MLIYFTRRINIEWYLHFSERLTPLKCPLWPLLSHSTPCPLHRSFFSDRYLFQVFSPSKPCICLLDRSAPAKVCIRATKELRLPLPASLWFSSPFKSSGAASYNKSSIFFMSTCRSTCRFPRRRSTAIFFDVLRMLLCVSSSSVRVSEGYQSRTIWARPATPFM